ncbi:MAG TPA: class D sortase [Patescibacteria group bacterium]|nr:class D sortase [Patescibacteria group bacterium]
MDPAKKLRQESTDKRKKQQEAAANIVRKKIAAIHKTEPDAKEELKEVKQLTNKHSALSKHQLYMQDLSKSGRSLAEIQTAWHDYYQKLPDAEKHRVWQEFYSEHAQKRQKQYQEALKKEQQKVEQEHQDREKENSQYQPHHPSKKTKKTDRKKELLSQVAQRAQKSQKHPHAHALLFGLGMGTFVVFLIMFSFFNERFITPFIRPNQNVSATPIIVDPNQTEKVGPEAKIVIPKINVEAPVVYDEESIQEKAIQKALERGVVHYSITPNPGEKGNSVIVGHSSSNILNSGKYKFAFLLLKSLENDDTFYVQKDGVRYVYKVFNKFVTSPTDVSVLNPTDKVASMTLITCDPPGLSTNRLIIQAEQIFPDPNANKASTVNAVSQDKPEELAGNSPSLWQRILDAF